MSASWGLNDFPRGALLPLDSEALQRFEQALNSTLINAEALRTRLDGEHELDRASRDWIEALPGSLPELGAMAVRRLVAIHDAKLAAKNAAELADMTAQVERQMGEKEARRAAAWQRCPRRLAEALVLASAFTPDRLGGRQRDAWKPAPVEEVLREQLRLALLSNEEIRAEPVPRLLQETMVRSTKDAS